MKINRILLKICMLIFAVYIGTPLAYGGLGSLGDDLFRTTRVLGHKSLPEFLDAFGINGLKRAEVDELTELYKLASSDMDQFIGKNIPMSHYNVYARARSLLFFEFFDPSKKEHILAFVKHIGERAKARRPHAGESYVYGGVERVISLDPQHIYDEFASFLRNNFKFDWIGHYIGQSSLNPNRYMTGPDFIAALRSHGFSQPLTAVRESMGNTRHVRNVNIRNLDDVALSMIEAPVHYGHQGRVFINKVKIIASPYFVVSVKNVQFVVDEILFNAKNQFFAVDDASLANVSARFLKTALEAAQLQTRVARQTNIMKSLSEMAEDIWGTILRHQGPEGLRLHDEIIEMADNNPEFLRFMNTIW